MCALRLVMIYYNIIIITKVKTIKKQDKIHTRRILYKSIEYFINKTGYAPHKSHK